MIHRPILAAAILSATLILSASAEAKTDKAFVSDAVAGDMSEIELGQLAQQKATSADVKSFGQMLAADHQTALNEMQGLAKEVGAPTQAEPKAEARKELQKLDKLSGQSFDREFVTYMVEDHRKDIKEFEEQAKSGKGSVAETARKQLPVLQKHLQAAERLAKGKQG